ncbi:AAA family ATPase [Actinoplanes subglobosus]|uniref:AAA family ATPase n=1 Tax=Actinoplanes subglobosus TaxID=1547892 RepID=A0ABV8IX62_9ACTN
MTPKESVPSGGRVINQHEQTRRLKTALTDRGPAVIMVHGEPGVGKTLLVEDVLKRLGLDRSNGLRRISLTSHGEFSVKSLLHAIEGTYGDRHSGQDLLGRLAVLLEDAGAEPLVVWVDNAQSLVDPSRHHFRNLSIEEALVLIAESSARPVKVVLALANVPVRSSANRWPAGLISVPVRQLEPEHFRQYLDRLRNTGPIGLADLDQAQLYRVLRGIPRLADLFFAALRLSGNPSTGATVLAQLADENPDDVEAALAQWIVGNLSQDLLRVLAALVAFGTPVPLNLIVELLNGPDTAASVSAALGTLQRAGIVATSAGSPSGLFPSETVHHVLHEAVRKSADNDPRGPGRLYPRAAGLLQYLLGPPGDARSIEELAPHFATLRAWINAQDWRTAFQVIDQMHTALARWNATDLLIPDRVSVTSRLPSSHDEMRNANSLGSLYLARGQSAEARRAYQRARIEAGRTNDQVPGLSRIYLNMANLHWQDNDIRGSHRYFRDAFALADESGILSDHMLALAGLADCSRYWGDHPAAIQQGEEALSIARYEQAPELVRIAVRLARWYSELKRMPEAAARLDDAIDYTRRFAEDRPLLLAQRLDAQADLALDRGNHDTAVELAERAVATGLDLYDAATVLQARTTLGWAYLSRGRFAEAAGPIAGAMRYRREGHALIVLAMSAVIDLRRRRTSRARDSFDALRTQSSNRWANDDRDYAAAEFEGLALAGEHAIRGSSLRAAVEAFGRARAAVPAPAPRLLDRLQYLLGLLAPDLEPDDRDLLLAAAAGARSHTV